MQSTGQTLSFALRRAVSGGVLLVFGIAMLAISWNYPFGSVARMGPGFVPQVIGSLICLLALAIIVVDVTAPDTWRSGRLHWRGLAFVSAAITLFAVLIDMAGLVPSVFVAVAVSMLADDRARPLGVLTYSVAATFGAWLLFLVGLDLPIPAFWR